MLETHLQIIAEKVKEVEKWAEENRDRHWFDEYLFQIQYRLNEIKKYAEENNVPFLANARDIAEKHYDDAYGYSEEESSSSSYEEESSSYYEEDDDEDSDESNY